MGVLGLGAGNPVVGITNGVFTISDESDPGFGWTLRGPAAVEGGVATLTEGGSYFGGLSQTFVVPEGAQRLLFTIVSTDLHTGLGSPPDAFEVALLDADAMTSLVGTAAGLTGTDALLNIQPSGQTYFHSQVLVPGLGTSGEVLSLTGPITIEVDLTSVPAGTVARLYFDLLGFGDNDSQVAIDNVRILGEGPVPPVAVDDTAETTTDQAITINVLANDLDFDGTLDPTTVQIVPSSGPAHGTASADPLTGAILYQPEAGYDGTDSLCYTVCDNEGNTSNAALVSIAVMSVNTPPTVDAGSDAELDEGGTLSRVGSFADPDAGDSWTATVDYGLGNGPIVLTLNTDKTFELNSTYSVPGIYTVAVTITDAQGAEDGATFEVRVINVPPTVALINTTTSLAENTGTTARIKVADIIVANDAPGAGVLSLSGADTSLFEIAGSVLYLRAGTTLDYETNPALDVTVAVEDAAVGATPDDMADLSILVTEVNEAPAIALGNATTSLAENTNTSSRIQVADIVVTDDALGTNVLSLSGVDAALFEIEGRVLYLKAGTVLDYEANPQLDVTVAVDDTTVGATPDDAVDLSIAVIDVNEAPTVVLANGTTSLTENTDTTTRIKAADILVTDDTLGTNMLSLSGTDAGLFEIEGTVLYLKAGVALDYETNPQFDVAVAVDDSMVGSTPDDVADLSILITDVNEAPTVALANRTTSLAENTDTSTRLKVADIVVTDDALGTNVLSLDGTDASLFETEGMVLYLKVGVVLDYETNPQLNVTVAVDDATVGATLDDMASLSISVTDVNEAPSVTLANTTASLAENADTTTRVKVADIVVTDDALGTNVLGLSGADAALFEIEGRGLYLVAGVVLDHGSHPQLDVTVEVDDAAVGATPDDTAAVVITVTDATPPAAPVLSGITEDTGIVGDGITRDSTLQVYGTTEAQSTVELFLNGAPIGTAMAEANGDWTFDYTATRLDDGSYTLTATATDVAGNCSPESAALMVTVDTTAPSALQITAIAEDTGTPGDGITRDNTLVISGTTEANSTVEIFMGSSSIGTTTANGSGTWIFDYTGRSLSDGTYALTARATDVAGNTSAASAAFTVVVDTVAAVVTVHSVTTTNGSPELTGTVDDSDAEVVVSVAGRSYQAINHGGTWTLSAGSIAPALSRGMHEVIVTATDLAGNVGRDSGTVTVAPAGGTRLTIDIYPNRTPNEVYLSRNYTLYVVVFGRADFKVTDLDWTTVRFGRTGAEARAVRAPTLRDLNGDGILDALYGFMTFDCGFRLGDTKGLLTGKLKNGTDASGEDSVLVGS